MIPDKMYENLYGLTSCAQGQNALLCIHSNTICADSFERGISLVVFLGETEVFWFNAGCFYQGPVNLEHCLSQHYQGQCTYNISKMDMQAVSVTYRIIITSRGPIRTKVMTPSQHSN